MVAEAKQREQVARCYASIAQTYRASRVRLAGRSPFEAALDLLHRKSMVRFALSNRARPR